MATKVSINGFGRIGRNFFRAAKKNGADFDMVAVNDLTSAETIKVASNVFLAAKITFANDGLVIEYNDDYDLPDDVKQLGEDAIEEFKSEG